MLCEVIEDMEVDQMYVHTEINRILVPGGQLLISTPYSASARIVMSILGGNVHEPRPFQSSAL
ncbi:hypothetical protein [Aestuariivirga sp.]|uniref:hypothetical protein n=1 Tax=Aestuariivirga sp. TaxID=2650926 RepID=UPI0037839BA4